MVLPMKITQDVKEGYFLINSVNFILLLSSFMLVGRKMKHLFGMVIANEQKDIMT